ncbi:MAG: demethoxyubiquinone hydroxylase family protein, partial [Alphaproteobacteria bacterium]|nr:demethoxyubiquinone hydroxylase family protein [Alphaproteobacteria bacterium]
QKLEQWGAKKSAATNSDDEKHEILRAIRQFQAEEEEHRDIGLENEAKKAPAYSLLYWVVSTLSKRAIYIAERV